MDNKRVLIIAEDDAYQRQISDYLVRSSFHVVHESEAKSALFRIKTEQPDLVVLEVEMVAESGLTICKLCRKDYQGAIVLVSDRNDDLDQVIGLDMGADDYVHKLASPRLVLARCQAILRRTQRKAEISDIEKSPHRLEFGSLVIDSTMREAWLNNNPIELTSAEFDLLWLLSSHAGEVLTREEIFNKLRGIEYDGQDRSVDVRVSRIRPKVGDDPIHPRRIKTVRSKGYLFVGDLMQ